MKNVGFIESLAEKTFDTLDKLGILRPSIFESPTTYEKYPRLLNGFLLRRKEVKLAFKEWETKVLRDVKVSKDTALGALKDYEKFLLDSSQKVMENFDYFSRTSYSWALEYITKRNIIGEEFREHGTPDLKKNIIEIGGKVRRKEMSLSKAIQEAGKMLKDIIPKELKENQIKTNVEFLIKNPEYFATKKEGKR